MAPLNVPDFDQLPAIEGMPQGCAWGVFDQDGKKDLQGTLNFLTPEIVAAACKEAKDGVSISLNWPLDGLKIPIPGRIDPNHKVMTLAEAGLSTSEGWNDEINFDTQRSSQWDSLVHWQDQKSKLAYNGIKVTKEALSVSTTGDNKMPTLDHWHERGGLVARGVLLDFKAWYEQNAVAAGKSGAEAICHPFGGHRINVADIEAVAKDQNVQFQAGDVLIIRTGMTETFAAPTADDFAMMQKVQLSGVDGTTAMAKWLWNQRFAAVASDNISFEALPPLQENREPAPLADLVLHGWLLSMFGMPIGELWDLKALSAHCKKTGRYTFLLTSVPLNLPGLVGSPPNALAIF
ncbi:putative cyclase-domain-containing protein [Phaeosphaeriaceae sp. PMI808]|nr:putative cyclase-domain-containing protein [Phaeosphaeriaceae sp. PMI808]